MKQKPDNRMPLGGVIKIGQTQNKPASESKIKYGSDLRDGGGKSK
jgi:hypothetical protein